MPGAKQNKVRTSGLVHVAMEEITGDIIKCYSMAPFPALNALEPNANLWRQLCHLPLTGDGFAGFGIGRVGVGLAQHGAGLALLPNDFDPRRERFGGVRAHGAHADHMTVGYMGVQAQKALGRFQ
jgi:hypothetical protein